MADTRLLILLVFISSSLISSISVQGRVHHHHRHYLNKAPCNSQSIAVPPTADHIAAEPAEPVADDTASATSPPPPPPPPPPPLLPPPLQPIGYGSDTNSTNSTSMPIAPPPSDSDSNLTSAPTAAPIPQPINAGNSTNSTTHPPTAAPISQPINAGNSTKITTLPPTLAPVPAPNDARTDVNSLNSTAVFNVRSFGGVGDGLADDTEAFKSAWVSACENGPGILLAPQGYTFMIQSTIFTGPCQSSVVFQIDGTVVAPDGPDSWPAKISKRQWIVFYRADGMSLQGSGTIDGKGEKWWSLPCKPHKGINGTTLPGNCDSPVALRFFQSSNLTVHGIRIRNSPQFHFRFDNCRNVAIDSLSINSPALSPNTDGIHIENTNNIRIYNSVISNGDDCISIGSGSLNVDIKNVTCGPSHGISIGSLGKLNSRACVANITVRNTVIKHSDNGVRIKTWQGGSGSVSSITFDNIHMDTVRNPIIIDQYYCLSKECANQTSAIYISDVSYINIKGTYDVRSPPVHLECSDSVPCTNITMTDVELLPAQGNVITDAFCWNVYGASQTLTIPPISCLLEGLPRMIMEDEADKCY